MVGETDKVTAGTPHPTQPQAENRGRDTTEKARYGLPAYRCRIKALWFKIQLDQK